MRIEEFYKQALKDLEHSGLISPLSAAAAAIVTKIPAQDTDMSCCCICERVLCGACGKCHGYGSGLRRVDCPGAQEMTWACAVWFQAYRAVRDVQRRGEQWSDW